MASGKHSTDSVKIQLTFDGKNVFFARIKKFLWEQLKQAIKDTEYTSRLNWIRAEIVREFGLTVNSKEDLEHFKDVLPDFYYEDSNDWLRERIRNYLNTVK